MSEHDLNNCGCCDPNVLASTVANPPGLSWLAYRIGTHGAFMRRMLAHLPHEGIEDGPNRSGTRWPA